MIKKILGGLFFVAAILILIGSIANGSFMGDHGSVAATYGAFVGTMLPIIVNVCAGIFLIRFDRVYKMTYIEGFKVRKKQCSIIILFFILYDIGMIIAVGNAVYSYLSGLILVALLYFAPVIIFMVMLGVYATPYWACRKNFKLDDSMLNDYFYFNATFYTYSEDNSVLASDKVLFFPKTFCIMPFSQIASAEFKNSGIEQDVIFKLVNGKKIEMVAGKKRYEEIASAIAAHEQNN